MNKLTKSDLGLISIGLQASVVDNSSGGPDVGMVCCIFCQAQQDEHGPFGTYLSYSEMKEKLVHEPDCPHERYDELVHIINSGEPFTFTK